MVQTKCPQIRNLALVKKRLLAFTFITVFAQTAAAAGEAEALTPVQWLVDSMNKGDLKSALTACGDEMSIVDDVAPYQWHAKGACEKWAAPHEADSTKKGISAMVFEISKPTRFEISQDNASSVLPAGYTFKIKGKPGHVKGTLTVALQGGATGWHMTGFAFAQR